MEEGKVLVKKAPLLNPLLRLFMVTMVLANISGNMYGPLLPLYLRSLDANVLQVGLFFTLSQIVPLMLQIVGGWISDSLGRLKSIAIGSVAGALSYIGLILAPTWGWVLAGEGLASVTRSLVAPSFQPFIAEQSTEETRGRVFALTEMIFTIVTIIGPPLGGWLVDTYGFKFMLVVAGVLYTFATIIRGIMARKMASSQPSNPGNLTLKSLGGNLKLMAGMFLGGGLLTWILVTDGVRDISFAASFNLMPVYLEDIGKLSVQQIGWLSSVFGIASLAVNWLGGWLADHKGERVPISLGFALVGAAILVFVEVDTYAGFILSWALFGAGVGLLSPSYSSLMSKAIPEKIRGTAFGLLSTSLGIFSLPAPAIGAQLWERVSPQFPFQITAGVTLLTIIPIWLKFKLPKNGEVRSEE